MISRIWHGYTTVANADAHEALLRSEIFTGIGARRIPGYRGIQLFRRSLGEEVEFITVMWFESLSDVRALPAMTTKWPWSRPKRGASGPF